MGKDGANFTAENISPGPVITISREVGCSGLKIARKLADKLNKNNKKQEWTVFSKEIFEETSRELEMNEQKLKKILKAENRNTFDEILEALGDKRFKSEQKIKKTVINLIKEIAIAGHCIIVGRGGYFIVRNIPDSLHLRFTAPLEWRINKIAKRHHISKTEALIFINKTEKERESIRKKLNPEGLCNEHYDMEINVSAFSTESVVELLEKSMSLKIHTFKRTNALFDPTKSVLKN